MVALIKQKQWELKYKRESLMTELDSWKALVAKGEPLEKHQRQVYRISEGLGGMLAVADTEVSHLESERDAEELLYRLPRAEFLILEIHRTWQFFREKLMVRQGPPYANFLEALDELVWRCYEPAFTEAPEPPLVFFSDEWSPKAFARWAPLALTASKDPNAARYGGLFDQKRLSARLIPSVSTPWFSTTFLPLALLLAHEAAHLVDFDLELSENMKENLSEVKIGERQIDRERLENQWIPWSREVFADLYGTLVLGPAFGGALELLLSRSQDVFTADAANNYPPYHLRLRIVLEAMKQFGYDTQATELADTWKKLFRETRGYAFQVWEEDIDLVVKALLLTSFDNLCGGKSLAEISELCWNDEKQRTATEVCENLWLGGDIDLGSSDPRVLIAGAQLAFQDGPGYFIPGGLETGDKPALVVRQILAGREPGVRSRDDVLKRLPAPEDLAERDQARGRQLAESLLSEWDEEGEL